MDLVPTLDLVEAEKNLDVMEPLDRACRDHGFFLLRNHAMDEAIENMWRESKAFFAQPMSEKRRVARTESSPLGYYDRELTKRKRDQKEVFDFMMPRAESARGKDADGSMHTRSGGSDVNQWPDNPGFRAAMEEFFSAASGVAARTLSLVYRALIGDREASVPPGDARTSTVRLNYYPYEDPLEASERENVLGLGDMALHHHTDPGVLTLLLQDMTGGLQTLSKAHGWIDVPPEEGTIVVNLGDSLQVWTNDVYRAAVHRVVPMRSIEGAEHGRFSTPYFYNPKNDAVLEPVADLMSGEPVYEKFTWREYIKGRVDDNYADLGEDDIQIDRFKIG